MYLFSFLAIAVGLLRTKVYAVPAEVLQPIGGTNQGATNRMVFAHFMMGIVPNRNSSEDYDNDMKLAHAAGIDAFALNIGTDPYNVEQLKYAYASAAGNNMKVFISFDMVYFTPDNPSTPDMVGSLIKQFADEAAQLKVDGKVFVSSFIGDSVNVQAIRDAAGVQIFFAPNFHPTQTQSSEGLNAALNWQAWDSDGAGRAPKSGLNISVAQYDKTYTDWLEGKDYIAPVSPWFHTHYGNEVSYPKNWVYPGDLLWWNRWNYLLSLDDTVAPRFVEILTWNDYGESHYIGPLSSKHTDDGNSKWANDMPHLGFLDMAAPFIKAYKSGAKTVSEFEADKLIYWYRPTPRSIQCSETDTVGAPPDGFETLEDRIFVVSLLAEPALVSITSGSNTQTFNAAAGANAFSLPMAVGPQAFSLTRSNAIILQETSLREVVNECICGLYNFNTYVGTVPSANGVPDHLDDVALASFKNGLKNTTCEARPSLVRPAAVAAATRSLP
ncbi:glycoside hydrolase family 71 protein [Lophiotrema nucula]|uniref:Glycoside hydrolase family 71 protein n=1 Tax=Lophiotrema nucula TaxID=690887 RepID=A0A6A5ZS99_9PLEO|nr:glycoside hydrolase family 71 protein [Lophiotrema nucula]